MLFSWRIRAEGAEGAQERACLNSLNSSICLLVEPRRRCLTSNTHLGAQRPTLVAHFPRAIEAQSLLNYLAEFPRFSRGTQCCSGALRPAPHPCVMRVHSMVGRACKLER
jgi:hypothetical protein